MVSATSASWVNTGVSVESGQSATLKVVSGNGTCHVPDAYGCVTGQPQRASSSLCSDLGDQVAGPAGADIPWGAMVGRIGATGRPFLIGHGVTLRGQGDVYLIYNDCGTGPVGSGYRDNAGAFTVSVNVSGGELSVAVSATPSKIQVPSAEQLAKGASAVKLSVKVTFTNTSKVAIEGVQLLSLVPVPVDHTQALKKLAFPDSQFPMKLGTFAPGSFATRSFTLDVSRGSGIYQIEALALYDDPSAQGGNARAFAVGGQFEVAPQLSIEGTIRAVSSCSTDPCPAKPLAGVTVTAAGANGGGRATTAKDGTYSIGVPEGQYMVTATYQHKEFAPVSRSVTVSNSKQSGVDFDACAARDGAPSIKTKPACQGPVLEVQSVQVTPESINLRYRGTGWDPSGGPIRFSFSGASAGEKAAEASFSGVLRIAFWPKRTNVASVTSGSSSAYCWGELAARQGSSFATSGIVKGAWAGWILWSADPRIHAREAWCEGENDTLLKASPLPIVAFGFFGGRGLAASGIVAFNLSAPGQQSPVVPLLANRPVTIGVPSRNICVHITGGTDANLTIATTPGGCT